MSMYQKSNRALPRFSIAIAMTLALAGVPLGCTGNGPATYRVEGRVTYRGAPVTNGNVMFLPETGPAAVGAISADGTFALQATAGMHRVGITALERHPEGYNPLADDKPYVAPKTLVPAKYNLPAQSGLQFQVQPKGANVANFDL